MNISKQINTLSEFLMQAQTQYIILDLGRGIRLIDNQVFFEWENQQSPCSFPRQGYAWLSIVFWNEKLSEERYIWFVKLPLDENGLLIQAARNEFLEIIVKALGENLEHQENANAQLPDNPYIFTPSQQQLADCNAHVRRILGIATNSTKARRLQVLGYIQAPQLHENQDIWQHFSVQDMADFVIHPENSDHNPQDIVAINLKHYPKAVFNCLLASFESIALNGPLSENLISYHRQCTDKPSAALCLRAMSHATNEHNDEYIRTLIANEDPLDIETCVVIAGRYWRVLTDAENLSTFMQKVALSDPSFELFSALYTDLVKIPECRSHLLALLRSENRSELVGAAIGKLFQ